jgi:DNA helicase-2/ATP-dependent DNA helicase PcrA
MELDKSQLSFCKDAAPHVRLLAPAGCGKTLSLLFRCAHLAEKDSGRQRFLIVTFTRAANQELRTRLNEDRRFATIRDNVEITTLNSWGYRRIRNAASYPKLITDKSDRFFAVRNQLQSVWKNHEAIRLAIEENPNVTPGPLMEVIDAFKSLGFDHVRHTNWDDFSQKLTDLRDQGLGWKLDDLTNELTRLRVLKSKITSGGQEVAASGDRGVYNSFFRFWRDAAAHLIDNATFTLEDQKYFAYLDERQKLEDGSLLTGAARYDHVLVDEFQDINPLDLALIKAITDRSRSTLTVVGDDDQAIFEWRGATPEYILAPGKFFGYNFKTHTLSTNYRSPRNIVDHSQMLIEHNKRRVPKEIAAYKRDNARIEIIETSGLANALETVYSEVQGIVGKGGSPSRVAIIGRKRAQIIPYQIFFAAKDVSFCAAEDLHVFLSKTFDRVLELLMIKERAALRVPRGQVVDDLIKLCDLTKRFPLSRADREGLRKYLQNAGPGSLLEALRALVDYEGPLKGANPGGQISLSMATSITAFLTASTVSDALLSLAGFGGLQADFGRAEDDIFFSDPPLIYLAEYAATYKDDYGQFIDDIEQAKDQLVFIPPFEEDGPATTDELWKRPVHLMTAPRAKGKEFDSVILLDVIDGIWPNKNSRTPEELEAERRVFYVAFTRAMKNVIILTSTRLGNREAVPSPYISELGLEVA